MLASLIWLSGCWQADVQNLRLACTGSPIEATCIARTKNKPGTAQKVQAPSRDKQTAITAPSNAHRLPALTAGTRLLRGSRDQGFIVLPQRRRTLLHHRLRRTLPLNLRDTGRSRGSALAHSQLQGANNGGIATVFAGLLSLFLLVVLVVVAVVFI